MVLVYRLTPEHPRHAEWRLTGPQMKKASLPALASFHENVFIFAEGNAVALLFIPRPLGFMLRATTL
jgi:hypothetical protein